MGNWRRRRSALTVREFEVLLIDGDDERLQPRYIECRLHSLRRRTGP
jgi:hypothetical protein